MNIIDVRRTSSADYGRFIKALICGAPGAGKTLLSSTFPNPLFLVTEPGLMSVADRDVPYVEITSSDLLHTVLSALQQKPDVRAKMLGTTVDTVVIDTIDELQLILVAERLRETKKEALQLQDYGWLKEQTSAILKGFRNLDLHVVFTCHLKDDKDETTGFIKTKPSLAGAIANDIPGYVDLSILLRANTETRIVGNTTERVIARYLQTFPDPSHDWIKDRSGKLPTEFEVNFTDDFERMATRIYGSIPVADQTLPDAFHEAPVSAQDALPEAQLPEVAPESTDAAQGTTAPAVEAADSYANCTSCGIGVDENTADYSQIKARKILCTPCLKAA